MEGFLWVIGFIVLILILFAIGDEVVKIRKLLENPKELEDPMDDGFQVSASRGGT